MAEPISAARRRRIIGGLRFLPIAAAALFVATFAVLAWQRMRYPFELEWMEGAMADAVWRVLHGKKLYVAPTLDYVPFIYPPLYFYVSAAASALLHGGFLPLRLVSALCTLGSCWLAYRFVARETELRSAGVLAAGLFAATYRASGAWLDLARIDSLFLLLLLWSFYVLRFWPTRGGSLIAAVLLSLSFLTKQVALPMALPLFVYAIAKRRGTGLWYAIAALAIGVGATCALDVLHDDWYAYFLFTVPAKHSIDYDKIGEFWRSDLWPAVPIAIVLGAGYWLGAIRAAPADFARERSFYLCAALGMIAGSWVTRLHFGSAQNVLIPAFAAIAIGLGLAVGCLWQSWAQLSGKPRLAREALLAALLLAQFFLLRYDPRAQLPTHADLAAGEQLVQQLKATSGEVLIPLHGQLAVMAGKSPHAHQMALQDIYRGGWRSWKVVNDQIEDALHAKRFALVILDYPGWHREALERSYEPAGSVFGSADVFWPVTGMRARPNLRYVPRRTAR